MLYVALILVFSVRLCVAVTTRTFLYPTTVPTATPTVARKNITSTRTHSVSITHVQTPTPHFPVGWKSSFSNGNITSDASNGKEAPLASDFGTNCCGWGGIYGWDGDGEVVATMAGFCGPGLPLSTLDLNQCISWDSSSGFASCGSGGGFLSDSGSGCQVISPPSLLGQAFGTTYTQIWIVCNGPAANTGYITEMDLNICIGVDDSGQLTC